MPRGNDADDAARELAGKYPNQTSNAETLVQANRKRRSTHLRAALKLEVNEEATAALTDKAVSDAAGEKIVPGTGRIRGKYLVFVANRKGRYVKRVVPASKLKADDDGGDGDGETSKSSGKSSGKSSKSSGSSGSTKKRKRRKSSKSSSAKSSSSSSSSGSS
jgi:hypothetical protein